MDVNALFISMTWSKPSTGNSCHIQWWISLFIAYLPFKTIFSPFRSIVFCHCLQSIDKYNACDYHEYHMLHCCFFNDSCSHFHKLFHLKVYLVDHFVGIEVALAIPMTFPLALPFYYMASGNCVPSWKHYFGLRMLIISCLGWLQLFIEW